MFSNKYFTFIFFYLTLNLCALYSSSKLIEIVAISEDFSNIAKTIGGDLVNVQSLVSDGRDLHEINAKPSMVMKVKKADLLIRLGAKQDTWIDGLLQVARNTKVFPNQIGHLDCSNRIKMLDVPNGKIDGRHGDVHINGNPHYWLSPKNGKIIAYQILMRLVALDPKNKAIYNSNYEQFANKIDENIIIWKKELDEVKDTNFITYHKVWRYFFDEFNLTSIGELEPLPGIPPTTRHLFKLKQSIKTTSHNVKILAANYYPEKIVKNFAKSSNVSYKLLPTSVGDKNVSSYIDLFSHIVSQIKND